MPIFEYLCAKCGRMTEILITHSDDVPRCEGCGSTKLKKLLSAQSSLSGSANSRLPGAGDSRCCGTTPADSGCAGPGSCCGKR